MADEYGLQGLNGPEIIENILAKLRKRLEGDCSLRPQDSYSRGFSAKITYHVECYGLDKEMVDSEFEIGTRQAELGGKVNDGELIVPQKEDVTVVREETALLNDMVMQEEGDPEETSSSPVVAAKRKYTKKLKLASPGVIGGAEEFAE